MPILQSEKNCVRFFTDFSADIRSEKRKITLVATFMDICFSLPRSIPAIAEKQTQKIAGTHSSKFVFYEKYPCQVAHFSLFTKRSNRQNFQGLGQKQTGRMGARQNEKLSIVDA